MKGFQLQSKLKKYFSWRNAILFFLPTFLCSLLVSLSIVNRITIEKIQTLRVLSLPFSLSSPALYPVVRSILGVHAFSDSLDLVHISAKSAVVIDDNSKVLLYAKNPTLRFSMASTVKIMTALVGLEYYKSNDILEVKTSDVYGTVVGLAQSEHFTFQDLLYAMLLPSGNDAAFAIAQNYAGGLEAFVEAMNEKARNLHLLNTHFSDPAGLIDDGDYTTVVDLARLASKAMQNPTLAQIVSERYKTIRNIEGSRAYTLENLNKLLGIDGVTGIKTGFTDEAGGVLVTSKTEKGHRLIIVVMKSEDRFLDTRKLLSQFSENIIYSPIHQ